MIIPVPSSGEAQPARRKTSVQALRRMYIPEIKISVRVHWLRNGQGLQGENRGKLDANPAPYVYRRSISQSALAWEMHPFGRVCKERTKKEALCKHYAMRFIGDGRVRGRL